MPQFLINKEINIGQVIEITGKDAHHIKDVLRLKEGNWIVVSDGKGKSFQSRIEKIGKDSVSLYIEEERVRSFHSNLTLAIGLIKFDGIEYVIQKAVELGCTKIIPFESSRTISKFSATAATKKLERWNKIAVEAAKQCGVPVRPEVLEVVKFEKLLGSAKDFHHKILFYEGEESLTLEQYFQNVYLPSPLLTKEGKNNIPPPTKEGKNNIPPLCKGRLGGVENNTSLIIIGPEGGFSSEEVALAKKAGFASVGLGPLILRVETAAVSAITLTQYFLGYF